MKRILALVFLSLLSFNSIGQGGPIRGEISAGSYVNIKSDAAGNLYVTPATGVASTFAYTTTTATVTNSSATLLAANTSRKFLTIQNNDAAGIVYINFTSAATVAHYKIPAGGTLILDTVVTTQLITAIGSIASNANVVVIEGQ